MSAVEVEGVSFRFEGEWSEQERAIIVLSLPFSPDTVIRKRQAGNINVFSVRLCVIPVTVAGYSPAELVSNVAGLTLLF